MTRTDTAPADENAIGGFAEEERGMPAGPPSAPAALAPTPAEPAAEAPSVGVSLPHESAALHVTGAARYTDDLPELHGTLHLALGLSPHAHARIVALDLEPVRRAPGVVAVLSAADIPGVNNCGPVIHDDPILARDEVCYVGQPVFAVVATSHELARRAATLARDAAVVRYAVLPAVLTPREAKARNAFVLPPLHLKRGDAAAKIAAAPHRLAGEFEVGGQEQFYLEGQVAYAAPQEMDGMRVWCSTQHPSEMQQVVAEMLGWPTHTVVCECRRMGGGFGGKESQSALFACVAALAAHRLGRPVKVRADRDDDFMITGKRHDAVYDYEVGFDDAGRILGARADILLRAGYSADLSGAVATRALCHFDNAYFLEDVDVSAYPCRTNTQSNTAFRGFGGPQGALLIEIIVDAIARHLGQDPLAVRRANFYGVGERDMTPYGQRVADNVLTPLVDALAHSSRYAARREAIARYNCDSPVLKRGLALTPVKFGISFNVPFLNQAGALVHVYKDGSVLVNHGGTEMGQGLNTKVAQIVANELGVDAARVRCTATDTSKVANTSATAASTGTDLNGKAAENAARTIRLRLAEIAARRLGGSARDIRFAANRASLGDASLDFTELVAAAYLARVQLWSDGFYATPEVHWDSHTLTGRPFYYFAYGAAVSEVVIDTLTGEYRVTRADLLHDAGRSINPALDLGQIEGGFIQGMGWLTTEELCWDGAGRLTTHAPSTYKIPAISDLPEHFDTRLFDNPNVEPTVFRSKAVGEPPLLLAFSVFLALRDAVAAAAPHTRVAPHLRAPATPEAIVAALARQDAARDAPIVPSGAP